MTDLLAGAFSATAAPAPAGPEVETKSPSDPLAGAFAAPAAPEPTPLQPAEQGDPTGPQFSVFGSALPGTHAEAKGRSQHPLTAAVNHNLDIQADTDPTFEGKVQAIATATGMVDEDGKPLPHVRNIHPSMMDNFLERQDVQFHLDQARQTRKRMAVDAEFAAVIKRDIPIMAASEETIARFGLRRQPPYVGLRPLPREKKEFVSGVLEAATIKAATIKQGEYLVDHAEELLQEARDADAPLWEVIKRAGGDITEGVTGAPGSEGLVTNFLFDAVPRVWDKVTASEGDGDRLRAEAKATMKRAVRNFEATSKMELPDAARPFMDRVNAIRKDAGAGATANAMFIAMQEEPVSAVAAMTVLLAEQSINIGLSMLTRKMTGSAKLASSVGIANAYSMERFRPAVEHIQKKFNVDLTTEEGLDAFMASSEMQEEATRFGQGRAIPIALASALSFGLASKRLAPSATLNIVAQMPGQMGLGVIGELGAMKLSDGNIIWADAYMEGLIEGHPASIAANVAIAASEDLSVRRDAKRAEEWLKTGNELKGHVRGITPEALTSASEVLAERFKGEGVEIVYLNPTELMRFDQDGSAIDTLGLTKEQVTTAAREGHDVEISVESYIRHILGKDGFDALIEHTSTDMDGLTPAEAKKFLEEGGDTLIIEELEKQAMEKVTRALGVDDTHADVLISDAEAIKSDIAAQLTALSKYSGDRITFMAMAHAQRYVARAVRATKEKGEPVSALELYMSENVVFAGSNVNVKARAEVVDPLQQSDTWRDQPITVNNADGTTSEVLAGEQFDGIDRERKMAQKLLECVNA